jgi:hypothetical protein
MRDEKPETGLKAGVVVRQKRLYFKIVSTKFASRGNLHNEW